MKTKCQIRVTKYSGPAVVAALKTLNLIGEDRSSEYPILVVHYGEFSWNSELSAESIARFGPIITLDQFLNSIKPSIQVELDKSYTAVVSSTGIIVGCTTFPLDIVEKLAQAKKELGL